MNFDFITIGGSTRDISIFTDQGVVLDNKKDVLRQTVLAFELGAKINVDKYYQACGGGAVNAAVCLANFGLRTACLTAIGNDDNGQLIVKDLKNSKVDTKLVRQIKNVQSGSSFVLVTPTGERIIFAERGANKKLVISSSDILAVKKAKNIYIASLAGAWQANLKKIFSVVKSGQVKVFWNPGLAQYSQGLEGISQFMDRIYVLSLNKDEAIELVFRTKGYSHLSRKFLNKPENLLKIVHSFGPEIVVITLGIEGVIAYDGHHIYQKAIHKDCKWVDSTGVGDIFNSSFAAGLSLFNNIDRALELALKNAASKVGHLGAHNGLMKF